MTDAKRMYSFRLDDQTVSELDALAELYDREYERNFGHRPPTPGNRTVALITAVSRELVRQGMKEAER
jgi:hypothetical protein